MLASLLRSALAQPPAQARGLALRASAAVNEWVSTQNPKLYQRRPHPKRKGQVLSPLMTRRQQAKPIKRAIAMGEIALEPTVMPPPTRMKGHFRQRNKPFRQAEIEAKMREMPKMIEEYRKTMADLREARRMARRWK